jgi:hypothetical protein
MRTTVTLDQDVERLLRERMHRTRQSFKQTLNEAVRTGLAAQDGITPRPFEVRARYLGLKPGIDPAAFNRLVDDVEAEAIVEQMARDNVE